MLLILFCDIWFHKLSDMPFNNERLLKPFKVIFMSSYAIVGLLLSDPKDYWIEKALCHSYQDYISESLLNWDNFTQTLCQNRHVFEEMILNCFITSSSSVLVVQTFVTLIQPSSIATRWLYHEIWSTQLMVAFLFQFLISKANPYSEVLNLIIQVDWRRHNTMFQSKDQHKHLWHHLTVYVLIIHTILAILIYYFLTFRSLVRSS